jgi:hypothetical protein
MFTGNPHQDQRNLDRRGHKSFTSGWRDGWNDLKNDNIRDWQGPMNPGGQLPRPNPWNGKPFPKGQEPTYRPMTANYSQDKRIYDDWMVDDYLNQGIIMPDEVYDYSPGYKQVRPKLMGQELEGPLYFG